MKLTPPGLAVVLLAFLLSASLTLDATATATAAPPGLGSEPTTDALYSAAGNGAALAGVNPKPPKDTPAGAVAVSGEIEDLLRVGNRIYAAGRFNSVGEYVGSGSRVSAADGRRGTGTHISGEVRVSISDGQGGWFVGGEFRRVGGVRRVGLARILADGSLDPSFNAPLSGDVSTLVLVGSTLYAGGFFDVRRTSASNLVALDAGTGRLLSFRARQKMPVDSMVYDAGRLFVTTTGYGDDIGELRAVDAVNGAEIDSFQPAVAGGFSVLAADAGTLYAGRQDELVALDASTGGSVPGFDSGRVQGRVDVLLPTTGRLYVGGDLTSVSGTRGPLVALDLATGAADPGFRADLPPLVKHDRTRGVYGLALSAGRLWAGGTIGLSEKRQSSGLVALDPASGARRLTPSEDYAGAVKTLSPSGDQLFAGGRFALARTTATRNLAALNARTLRPIKGFRASAPAAYGREILDGGPTLYLAAQGEDSYSLSRQEENGRPRFYYPSIDRIIAINARTGAKRSSLNLRVKNLAGVASTKRELFVAQRLRDDQRFPAHRVTVYSTGTGKRLRTFLLPQRGYVKKMQVYRGDLYVGGSFRRTRPSGQRAHLALMRIDKRNGRIDSSFDAHTKGPVNDFVIRGRSIYSIGYYTQALRLRSPNGIGRFSLDTGAGFTRFDPEVRPKRTAEGSLGLAPGAVVLKTFGATSFLDQGRGRLITGAADGYDRSVVATVHTGRRLVCAARLDTGAYDPAGHVEFIAQRP